jgi:hypothetical protein
MVAVPDPFVRIEHPKDALVIAEQHFGHLYAKGLGRQRILSHLRL